LAGASSTKKKPFYDFGTSSSTSSTEFGDVIVDLKFSATVRPILLA
jgi:hypothetical protein